jgi:deazaflavin-dependent oxidoreductase (nitroreductase family)
MRLPDSWSFRQKPTGGFRRVLRVPVHLFRWRLGFLFGDRLVLLTHRGRTSGHVFRTALEVVGHDGESHEYFICSGTGPRADWYLNLQATPALAIQVRNRRWVPTQRFVGADEAARRFATYERAHPKAAPRLLDAMGNRYDGTDEGRMAMMARMPMVAFSDRGPAAPSSA